MIKFSLGNYIEGFIGGLPVMILPIIITNSIGAKFSAYFYLAMMIASLLYVIPRATCQSLFAEGSHSEIELKLYLKKAIKIISIIIIPAIIVIFSFGDYILLAFGKEYSYEGFILLKLLSISGIFISIDTIGGTILKIKHKIKLLILLSLTCTTVILFLSVLFIKMNLFGVVGVGIGWTVGQATLSLIYLFLIKRLLE